MKSLTNPIFIKKKQILMGLLFVCLTVFSANAQINHAPTIDPIDDVIMRIDGGFNYVYMTGLSDGDNCTQNLTITVQSSNSSIVEIKNIYHQCGPTSFNHFEIHPRNYGSCTITVIVRDDGGVENGGLNTYITDFEVVVDQPYKIYLPAKLEAENFTSSQGIQTAACTDIGGGKYVGWFDNGDKLSYKVIISKEADYDVKFRVANNASNGRFGLTLTRADESVISVIDVPNTNGWQNWTTVTKKVHLPAGMSILSIVGYNGPFNLNWFSMSETNGRPLPGIVQAEDFDNMYGINLEECIDNPHWSMDSLVGQNVGWVDAGDWMDYKVNIVTPGKYNVTFRVASMQSTGHIQLKEGSNILCETDVPNTHGWQTYTDFIAVTKDLTAGTHVFRIYATSGPMNINYIYFSLGGGKPIPGKIEAENYDGMGGIQTENCSDIGGGKNVGWIDTGDSLVYDIYGDGGFYNVSYRVATIYNGAKFETHGETINVPNTGGWQNWTTVTLLTYFDIKTFYYSDLILKSTGQPFNINWIKFENADPPEKSVVVNNSFKENNDKLKLFPNPVKEVLNISTGSETGFENAIIYDLKGSKVMENILDQNNSNISLNVGSLRNGVYMIRLTNSSKNKILKFIKQ